MGRCKTSKINKPTDPLVVESCDTWSTTQEGLTATYLFSGLSVNDLQCKKKNNNLECKKKNQWIFKKVT